MKKPNSPEGKTSNDKKKLNTTKQHEVFKAFLNGWKGHRFNAEHDLHDHCLHSTVSTIERKYHTTIDRKWVTVKGYKEIPTRVKVYWMNNENKAYFLNHQDKSN